MSRAEARNEAFRRADGRCQWPTCRRLLYLFTDNMFQIAHAHELTRRSAGGDPHDPAGIIILCWKCHADLHPRVGGKIKRIDGKLAAGLLQFFERKGHAWTEVGRSGGSDADGDRGEGSGRG